MTPTIVTGGITQLPGGNRMDISAHANRARHLAAEPTAVQRQRAEAEGWYKPVTGKHKKSDELVHPLARHEARLLRAERDRQFMEAARLI